MLVQCGVDALHGNLLAVADEEGSLRLMNTCHSASQSLMKGMLSECFIVECVFVEKCEFRGLPRKLYPLKIKTLHVICFSLPFIWKSKFHQAF